MQWAEEDVRPAQPSGRLLAVELALLVLVVGLCGARSEKRRKRFWGGFRAEAVLGRF